MTPIALAITIFAVMLVLMAARVPIAISMFIAGAFGYVMQSGWLPMANFLNSQAFSRFASYDLSVIPLFILMGHFATQGGISKALFEFAAGVMGRLRGGLAMGAVFASAAFGAICGSSVATAATITNVAYDEMRRHGYSGTACHRHAGRWRHAGYIDSALGAAGDLRDLDRTEYCQAVCGRDDPGNHRDGWLHAGNRDLCSPGARAGTRQ